MLEWPQVSSAERWSPNAIREVTAKVYYFLSGVPNVTVYFNTDVSLKFGVETPWLSPFGHSHMVLVFVIMMMAVA